MSKLRQKRTLFYADLIKRRSGPRQVLKACEEMGELMQALSRYDSYQSAKRRHAVHEEIVDVFILLEQLCMIFNLSEEQFNRIMEDKLRKLRAHMKTWSSVEKKNEIKS